MFNLWLLEASVMQAMEKAQAVGFIPTAEQQAELTARFGFDEDSGENRILTIAGDKAEISVRGVLTNAPSFMAMLFGGGNTTFPEIIGALAQAEQNPNVKETIMVFDSPGGAAGAGLFDAIAAMQAAKKPISAIIENLGASAAFGLISQADTVTAANIATRIGSVGTMAQARIDETMVQVVSTHAPKKNPDLSTAEGQEIIREELDAMHQIFVEAIASGRGKTVDEVNAEFGMGAVVLAKDALKRGMIDGIAQTPLKSVKSTKSTTVANGGNQLKAKIMNLAELQAQHPDLYAEAVKVGMDGERDRVTAHLTSGEMSGTLETAVTAAKDGSPMTETLRMTYMMAAANRGDIKANQDDSDGAAGGDDVSTDKPTGTDLEATQVVDIVEAAMGLEAAGGVPHE